MRFVGILIDGVTSPSRENEHQFWDNLNTKFMGSTLVTFCGYMKHGEIPFEPQTHPQCYHPSRGNLSSKWELFYLANPYRWVHAIELIKFGVVVRDYVFKFEQTIQTFFK